jgi:exonuclease SbcC
MRIHRLEIEAIGPFADRVVVDVDDLAAGGLFLVHGPTGSGKTSLLDAVCFALFADVPGARARHALRSDHAPPAAVPEVVLELTAGSRRLRLTRSPEWHRPKKRGTGLTRVQPSVHLEELRGGSWTTLSTRHDEVADVVKDLLGMGLAQFAKVVLLPQGDFAAFLRATPEDRREVLEKLFDIGVFADVEQWLADQRRSTGAALEQARALLAADLTRVEDAVAETEVVDAGAEPPPGDEPSLADLPPGAVPERVAALAARLEGSLTAAMADLDAATGAEQLVVEALAEAREVLVARGRGLQARVRAAALAAATETHDARAAELDAAQRAAGVAGHLTAHDRAVLDLDRATELVARRRSALATLGVHVDDDAAGQASRVHALDDACAELGRQAQAARRVAATVAETAERREAAGVAREAAEVELAATRDHGDRLRVRAEELTREAAREGEQGLRVEECRRRLALLDLVEADRAARAELAPRLVAARDAVLTAQARVIDLRQRRLDGMAAELAGALTDGAPCPVCGASEHPAPAETTAPVSAEELDAAEAALAEARADLGRVEATDTALAAAVDARTTGLDDPDRPTLEAALDEARADHAASRAAATRLEAVEHELAEWEHRRELLTAEGTRAAATEEAHAARLAELAEEAETVRGALEAAAERHSGCECGAADPAGHVRVAAALDDLVAASVDEQRAGARHVEARADLDAALVAAGFTDDLDARAAARPPEVVDELRTAVAAHEHELGTCRAVLTEPAVVAALAGRPPDLAALEEATRAARHEVLAASTAQAALARAVRALERLRPHLEQACAEVADLAERHARVRELADAVAGTGADNTMRMRLTSFVLAARLEKVAALANERLRVMGEGRYLLEHSDDRAARGARSGLGLRVLDQWTGRARDTASLSGGESFMASLALALGLADAVREEAGGLDLGTLFVDEGFGSLDEDSLEEVLTVLDGLREGGRAVGVVSHVADLRARIPYQAVVHKGTSGSTVEVRTGERAEPAA